MGLAAKQVKPIEEYINQEKTVGDLMKPLEVCSSVSADTSLQNAVYILKNAMSSQNMSQPANYLLVFEHKSLIGFVGISELFAAVQPLNIRDDWYQGWNVTSWSEPVLIKGLFTRLCVEMAEKPVRDVVQPVSTWLSPDSTLEEAVYMFHQEKRDMLPVKEAEKLVGILRACDLFEEMAGIVI